MNSENSRPRRGSTESDGYVLAASVVDTFQPERLKPVRGFDSNLGRLLDLSVMSRRNDGSVGWRLPNDIRRHALQVLSGHQRLFSTLEDNRSASDGDSPYQLMFEQYVLGQAIPLESQNLDQLQASLNAVRLLSGMVPNLPDADEVRRMLHRQGLIRQFELLADEYFVGREDALRRLREFVDVLPEGLFTRMRRTSSSVLGSFGLHSVLREAPLVITGMGGMGKTALLSKFLLEHLRAKKGPDLLFAYIDFDKPSIWPDQPLTVLAEIARQLALQVPSHAAEFQALSSRLVEELQVTTAYGDDFDSSEALLNLGTHSARLGDDAIAQFAAICHAALERASLRTLLLVCDTFEEVSQRSILHQRSLLQFVGQMQRVLPRLRVVVSGRGMHEEHEDDPQVVTGLVPELVRAVQPLELEELSEEESCHLLVLLGAPNPRTNKAIVRRVGGHPLSLRLAAQLVRTIARRTGRSPIDLTSADIIEKEWLDHMSEGLLYRRIIAHIPDEPMRKLADPGLVLREITAPIIFEVLNEACELGLRSLDEANELFERLKQFNQLVSIQSHDVVRHRPELRRRVLKEMRHLHPQLCREIWRGAARHYRQRNVGRAEELYCMLMLDEPVERLVERWEQGLENSLLGSRSEMPVRARQFLDLMALIAAGRPTRDNVIDVGPDLDTILLREEMKMLLARGGAKDALDLFRATNSGKVPRFDGVLYPVHVRAIAQSGDLDNAMNMALEGLNRLEQAGKTRSARYEELLLLCCQIAHAQLGSVWRTVRGAFSRRSKRIPASMLWQRFLNVNPDSASPVLVLRIAVVLLEIFDIEGANRPKARPGEVALVNACAERALNVLRGLRPDYRGVDGGLLLRGVAWLGAYDESAPDVWELLRAPQAIAVLLRDYKSELERFLMERRSEHGSKIIAWLRSAPSLSRKKPLPRSESDDINAGLMRTMSAALRHVIRIRDQGRMPFLS